MIRKAFHLHFAKPHLGGWAVCDHHSTAVRMTDAKVEIWRDRHLSIGGLFSRHNYSPEHMLESCELSKVAAATCTVNLESNGHSTRYTAHKGCSGRHPDPSLHRGFQAAQRRPVGRCGDRGGQTSA